LKIDLHVHTIRGSDCSVLTPEDLVERAAQIGLDGVCITEHDHVWRSSELEDLASKKGVLLFFGIEVNTEFGEVLAFGPEEYAEGFHGVSNLRRAVDERGGVIIAAHPFRQVFSPFYSNTGTVRPSIEQAKDWPIMKIVDSLEIINGASTEEETEFARSVAKELGLGMAGGSDAHSIDGLGMCVTEFERDITCWNEFLEELRAGRYRPVDLRTSLPPPS
jgi:predicted metal-dependent phosphoesterase TrpH